MKTSITNLESRSSMALRMRSFVKSKITLLLAGLICVGVATGITHAKVTRVACVGASNTFGWKLDRDQTYPAQMEEMLQRVDRQWAVYNLGVNGNSVLRQADNPYSTRSALVLNPDIIIFHFGPNATRSPNRGLIDEHFVSDYVDLIGEFSQLRPVPKMWICLPTALHSTRFTASPTIMDDKINPYIHHVAAITGLPIIDLFSAFKAAPELYQGDGIHLTSAGAALMAERVAAELLTVRLSPDVTGDFKVDLADLTELIEHLGTGDTTFDLVPFPDGDGEVDYLDLEGFMEFWGGEYALIRHFPLDESSGKSAQNAADWRTPGTVEGGPFWLPQGGQVGGALELDGVDDYINTHLRMNPADGVFSVFAWVKGGASEQVIISQQGGANWLLIDTDGTLMTELTSPRGRTAHPLYSEAVITDDKWHRVGLVWDGSQRTLYVDDVVVAEDTQSSLKEVFTHLYIGSGNNMDPGTFWAGLIDDVRIYDRAVTP